MQTIADIIGINNWKELQRLWGGNYFLVRGNKLTYKNIFSVDKYYDLLLNFANVFQPHNLQVSHKGVLIDCDEYFSKRLTNKGELVHDLLKRNVSKFVDKGATVILNGMQKYDKKLYGVTESIREEMNLQSHINSYYNNSGELSGFPNHYDTHDVLIFQIMGKKKWDIGEMTFKHPLKNQKFTSKTPPSNAQSIILSEGDFLYLPRGMWHKVSGLGRPSLHLTIGIHSETYVSMIRNIVNQLEEQEEFRKNLPLSYSKADKEQHDYILNLLSGRILELIEKNKNYLEKSNNSMYAEDKFTFI